MYRPSSSTTGRSRATAIGLTLLAHGAALLLVEIERRAPRREQPAELQYVSFWPQMATPPPQPQSVEPDPQQRPGRSAPAPASPRAIRVPVTPQQPAAPAPSPQLPATEVATEPAAGNPAIDWNSAAAKAAARVAQDSAAPRTFGPPLAALPEPCVERKFDKATKALMDEKLPPPPDPLPVGPNPHLGSMIVGGRPMAVFKITIPLGSVEPRGDLFYDMHEKKKISSVPSPHVCD